MSQVSEVLKRKKENGKEKLFVSYVHYPISETCYLYFSNCTYFADQIKNQYQILFVIFVNDHISSILSKQKSFNKHFKLIC